jgi:hypothetical protein
LEASRHRFPKSRTESTRRRHGANGPSGGGYERSTTAVPPDSKTAAYREEAECFVEDEAGREAHPFPSFSWAALFSFPSMSPPSAHAFSASVPVLLPPLPTLPTLPTLPASKNVVSVSTTHRCHSSSGDITRTCVVLSRDKGRCIWLFVSPLVPAS